MSSSLGRLSMKTPHFSRVFSSKSQMASSSGGLTFKMRPIPSKAHHHKPIPSDHLPHGYLLGGSHVGIKKRQGVLDLAFVTLDASRKEPAAAAGIFTRNASCAAPVQVCVQVLEKTGGRIRSVVVNSGCANAVTGTQGLKDAWAMVRSTDGVANKIAGQTHGSAECESLVMSTGVIGQTLPVDKIVSGINALSPSPNWNPDEVNSPLGRTFSHWENAAKAFMTTDTFPKLRARVFKVGDSTYRIGGMSKGAGMIHPNMGPAVAPKKELHATLLSLILTDAPVTPEALKEVLAYAGDRSFNSISVDGDMSTNDTVLVLANGAAPGKKIDIGSPGYETFRDELTSFAQELAQLVVRDGEGATKFVTVNVNGAATYADAHAIASRISTSALFKTAMYGEDANWGRILAAAGSVPPSSLSAPLDASKISVSLVPVDGTPSLPLLKLGEPVGVDEVRAKEILREEDVEVCVELGLGIEQATYWTCDYSYEYVRINGDYRS